MGKAWSLGIATEWQTRLLIEHHGSPPTMSWWKKEKPKDAWKKWDSWRWDASYGSDSRKWKNTERRKRRSRRRSGRQTALQKQRRKRRSRRRRRRTAPQEQRRKKGRPPRMGPSLAQARLKEKATRTS